MSFFRLSRARFCSPNMFLGRPISESSDHLIKAVQLIGVLYCVKTYGFDFSTTRGASMEPLIKEGGNVVVVDKLSHRFTGLSSRDRFQRGLERILECRLLCNWSMNAAISSELPILIASQRYEDVYTKVCN
jgi:hypothetical protein